MRAIDVFAARAAAFCAICLALAGLARAQEPAAPETIWRKLEAIPPAREAADARVRPRVIRAYSIDAPALASALSAAPMEDSPAAAARPAILWLPSPRGKFERFLFSETALMAPELAAKFPDIRTYVGQGIDDPSATLRCDWTPAGFHAQVLSPNGAYYIDPYSFGDSELHVCYARAELPRGADAFLCLAEEAIGPMIQSVPEREPLRSGATRRTYRLACAATGEYTAFHGGTVNAGLAAIVTSVNRVTGIYETELAIRLQLVANNNLIVYTNAATDPYTNANGSAMLGQNQINLDAVIGSANYDIGHVFSTGGGGIAGLGVACRAGQKAQGVTGRGAPVGDAFDIDYVAHELGHQFGANHCFNGTSGSCGGNRSSSHAYEPGSGSTIMAYAGICGSDNVQSNSDPYFHSDSFDQIIAYTASGAGNTCPATASTGNAAPTVNAGANYTIPRGTAFALTAAGSDPNGDALTYCWEERDLGPSTALLAADNGQSPIFRSFAPSSDPARVFPRMADILDGSVSPGEQYPQQARTFTFRVTARDNRAGGGGVNTDDTQVTVSSGAGPFRVTAPNGGETASGLGTVTWDVAGTASAPVSAAEVNILLSTDGGLTFPTVLAAATANDGSQLVAFPAVSAPAARIKIEAAGNIFFDISDANFTVAPGPGGVIFAALGEPAIDDAEGNGNANGALDPGESAARLSITLQNMGTIGATNVAATLASTTPGVTVVSGGSAYPNLPELASGANLAPFEIALDEAFPCGGTIVFELAVTSSQGNGEIELVLSSGSAAAPAVISYAGPAVAIPDGASFVEIDVAASNVGRIKDADFRFDGTSCSPTASSTTVGLNHSWVGHLTATLVSPQGTEVQLFSVPGGGTLGSNGNNFCQTRFDDDGGHAGIQAIVGSGQPYSGFWAPAEPLSALDGEIGDGTWTLRVADGIVGDSGSVRAFSIILSGTRCDPPRPPGSTGAATWELYE